jgi:hypothetical protein
MNELRARPIGTLRPSIAVPQIAERAADAHWSVLTLWPSFSRRLTHLGETVLGKLPRCRDRRDGLFFGCVARHRWRQYVGWCCEGWLLGRRGTTNIRIDLQHSGGRGRTRAMEVSLNGG